MKKLLLPMLLTAVTVTGLFGGCSCSSPNETPSFTEVSPRPDEVFMTSTPTPEPTKANTPTPSPMPTNTPTPEPTATPIPTPVSDVPIDWDDTEAEYVFQVGDNAYFEYYEDSTVLKVTGTGATWDFEYGPYTIIQENEKKDMVETVIVEEGITRLGDKAFWGVVGVDCARDIYLPNSLKEVGFLAFALSGEVQDGIVPVWHNLNLESLKLECNSFWCTYGLEDVAGIEQYMNGPTPIPTATPTPTPNPKQPKIMKSFPMGDNVTFEFWDNGYLYVKGSGATWDREWHFMHFSDYENPNWMTQEFLATITHLIVEEGVTGFGENSMTGISSLEYIEFPSSFDITTLEFASGNTGFKMYATAYLDGKKFTLTGKAAKDALAGFDLRAIWEIAIGNTWFYDEYKDEYELTWE